MSGAVRTATLASSRQAPRDLPSLPALRRAVEVPPRVPVLLRPRTLAECIEPFLFWLGGVRGRRPLTLQSYRRDLKCFAAFCQQVGIEHPADVRHQHIEFYLGWLQQAGERQAGTAARRLSTLRSFCRFLVREEIIPRDPAAVAFGPKVTRRLPVYLSIPEQERVLLDLAQDRTLKGRRDYAAIALLLLTGLRADELMTLDLGALDLEIGTLRVIRGKGDKDRELPVVPRLAAILEAYLRDVRPRLYRAATSAAVFLPVSGKGVGPRVIRDRLDRKWLWRLVAHRVSAIVGRRVYPHALRHSFASRLRTNGADLALIQEALGHSEIGTTTIYAHLATPDRLATLTRLLGGGPSGPGPDHPRGEATIRGDASCLPRRREDAQVGAFGAIGDRIREIRHGLGLRQPDLATKLGVGRMTIVRAERGAYMPRMVLLQRLAALAGVSVDWLLRDAP